LRLVLLEQVNLELTGRSGKLPFEMPGKFRENRGKLAIREKIAQQVLI